MHFIFICKCALFSLPLLCIFAETVVVFGCRNKEHDFYFQDEWKSLPVTFYAAFSRDQEEKIYVQDKIRENGMELWGLINEKNACIFVAG